MLVGTGRRWHTCSHMQARFFFRCACCISPYAPRRKRTNLSLKVVTGLTQQNEMKIAQQACHVLNMSYFTPNPVVRKNHLGPHLFHNCFVCSPKPDRPEEHWILDVAKKKINPLFPKSGKLDDFFPEQWFPGGTGNRTPHSPLLWKWNVFPLHVGARVAVSCKTPPTNRVYDPVHSHLQASFMTP